MNLADFARITGTDVNPDTLFESGLIRSVSSPVKILGEGEVDRAVTVNAHAFSGTAREKIEAAGGTAQVIE